MQKPNFYAMKQRTIFLLAGHRGRNTGAHGIIDEGESTIELRNMIELTLINLGDKVVVDEDNDDNAKVWAKARKDAKKDDILVDIHFNACNGIANGTETFMRRNATATEVLLASQLNKTVYSTLGTASRGIKVENDSQHSSLGVLNMPCNAVLLEVCFCDSAVDVAKYNARKNELAKNIAFFLHDFAQNASL